MNTIYSNLGVMDVVHCIACLNIVSTYLMELAVDVWMQFEVMDVVHSVANL